MSIYLPDCSEPDERYPNRINAMLRDIKRYRKQILDPEGYRKELADVIESAKVKKIKGSAEGGKKV
jgi:nucleosome binding factor SPN SPT16 subunit